MKKRKKGKKEKKDQAVHKKTLLDQEVHKKTILYQEVHKKDPSTRRCIKKTLLPLGSSR